MIDMGDNKGALPERGQR